MEIIDCCSGYFIKITGYFLGTTLLNSLSPGNVAVIQMCKFETQLGDQCRDYSSKLEWIAEKDIDDESTLVQVMVRVRQETSHMPSFGHYDFTLTS